MILHKMINLYQKWKFNPLSIFFTLSIIQIGDTWEVCLYRNDFTSPKNTVDSPLHFIINPSPCIANHAIKYLCVYPQKTKLSQIYSLLQFKTPWAKRPWSVFMHWRRFLDVIKNRTFMPLLLSQFLIWFTNQLSRNTTGIRRVIQI
jgi:hypothetical protein